MSKIKKFPKKLIKENKVVLISVGASHATNRLISKFAEEK